MITAKLDNKDIEELTINAKNTLGVKIQYNVTYFENLNKLETIALNGFDINDNLIEKINGLKKLKTIIFNHCKFINNDKLINNIENTIITYCNVSNFSIFKKIDSIKTIEMIGIDELDINDFVKMKNLIELSIYNSRIKNSKKITEFANLKILKLDGSLVDEPNFSALINENIEFSYNEKFYLEG